MFSITVDRPLVVAFRADCVAIRHNRTTMARQYALFSANSATLKPAKSSQFILQKPGYLIKDPAFKFAVEYGNGSKEKSP